MAVAFLGLGRMGVLMAGHVLSAGHDLVLWNRTPGRAGDLVARGAREAGRWPRRYGRPTAWCSCSSATCLQAARAAFDEPAGEDDAAMTAYAADRGAATGR